MANTQVDANMKVWDGGKSILFRTPSVWQDLPCMDIQTMKTVWTPPAGKRIRFLGGCVGVRYPCDVYFYDMSTNIFVFHLPTLSPGIPYNFSLGETGPQVSALMAQAVVFDEVTGQAKPAGHVVFIVGTLFGTIE